jgi:hypothetical protein
MSLVSRQEPVNVAKAKPPPNKKGTPEARKAAMAPL